MVGICVIDRYGILKKIVFYTFKHMFEIINLLFVRTKET